MPAARRRFVRIFSSLAVALALAVVAAGRTRAEEKAGSMGWNGQKDLVRRYVDRFNAGDLAGVRATFTDDAEVQGVMGWGKVDAALPVWDALMKNLAIQLTIDDIVTENDVVAVRMTEKGTARAPFFGHPATGKSYELVAMEWFQIENGKIRRRWGARDAASQAKQLGWDAAASKSDVTPAKRR